MSKNRIPVSSSERSEHSEHNDSSGFFSATTLGSVALVALGSYLVWRNRNKIEDAMKRSGISIPKMRDTIKETMRSGAEKVRSTMNEDLNYPTAI